MEEFKMKKINWNEVQEAQDFQRLVAGGYVCKITNVEDVPEKEYLKIEYDIIEGEFKDYYTSLFEKKNFWGGKFIKSYKDSAQSFFKAFLTAVEESNSGYKFNDDENTFKSKLIGLTLGEEEYKKNDGGTGVRIYVDKCRSIQKIRSNDFEIPKFKYLEGNEPTTVIIDESTDELPF
jgi:hypothetical protein